MSYAIKLGLAAMAFLLAGVLVVVIFDHVWFRVGFGTAFAILCGILLLIAWRVDRKEKAARGDLPNI